MREIQASEAETHLPRLLDEVERGETLIITRHGRAIARIVPEVDLQQANIDEAMDVIRSLRQRTGRIEIGASLRPRRRPQGLMAFVLPLVFFPCRSRSFLDH